jgi:hypothetical protein
MHTYIHAPRNANIHAYTLNPTYTHTHIHTYTPQALSSAGASVIACTDRDGSELQKLGAQKVVQYKKDNWFETLDGNVDIVVDALSNDGREAAALGAKGVRYVAVTSPIVRLVCLCIALYVCIRYLYHAC